MKFYFCIFGLIGWVYARPEPITLPYKIPQKLQDFGAYSHNNEQQAYRQGYTILGRNSDYNKPSSDYKPAAEYKPVEYKPQDPEPNLGGYFYKPPDYNKFTAEEPPTQPKIFKHVYIHVAPEEQEEARTRVQYVQPPPQKHYKIIFIKAPSTATRLAPIIPVQPQHEEKTLVYVLVKKNEEQEEVVLPPVPQKEPTKPEVYFIKYKSKKDSGGVSYDYGYPPPLIHNDSNKNGGQVLVNTAQGATQELPSQIQVQEFRPNPY
ncbi:unnamed protein product [Brassicogethes aeneus]|uniref:DUF243 domain-containing protein n=1 Tax=Brassicogethes aeneus TaxID=1431903 RepID=A0A9P0AUQ2_BRAAE|nr:unnamed protein product [Brassicogethes aeneus]